MERAIVNAKYAQRIIYDMNLKTLQRLFSESVTSIKGTYPKCDLFHSNVEVSEHTKWERLSTSGTLFLLKIDGFNSPFLYLLNGSVIFDSQDYHIELPSTISTSITRQYLYIKGLNRPTICIRFGSGNSPKAFVSDLKECFEEYGSFGSHRPQDSAFRICKRLYEQYNH